MFFFFKRVVYYEPTVVYARPSSFIQKRKPMRDFVNSAINKNTYGRVVPRAREYARYTHIYIYILIIRNRF